VTTLLARLYRLSLLAFPSRHRAAYADEMRDAFDCELRARRSLGVWSGAAFAIAALWNAWASGVGHRWHDYRVNPATTPFISRLDFVLAWRMLVRYPGLSVISVFGIAVGIAIAAGAFTIVSALTDAEVPLHEGERVVSFVNWDAATSNRELRMLHDVASWRTIGSIEDMGISRSVPRNLIVDGGQPEVVTVAEISASAFRLARVAPLRGRVLLPEDEHPAAADIVVIGYHEWLRRFGGDPEIVGRSLQLGSTTHQIVGVMPEGFAFPLFHGYWIPWRLDPSMFGPRSGPAVNVFARLAPGATFERVQAELSALGQRSAERSPSTHEHLRPRVVPYTHVYTDMDDPQNAIALYAIEGAIVLLLMVVCVNVAILVYARTATRQGEIAVRGALGASRQRIILQLFVEALLLAGMAAALGVGAASLALRQLEGSMLIVAGSALPFWMSLTLPARGVMYIVGLTLLAAAIVGVLPAVQATSRQVRTGLQTLSPGSGSRMQMGRVWTSLIVAQVALTVALLPTSLFQAWSALRFRTANVGFAAGEFLTSQVVLDPAAQSWAADDNEGRETRQRLATSLRELDRRLREDAAIDEVTFSMTAVGEEWALVLEVEGQPPPIDPVDYNIVEGRTRGALVRFNRVAANFFDAFEVPVSMGRSFQPSDAEPGAAAAPAVLINRTLADTLFGSGNPLGARIRYVGRSREAAERDVELERWYEIVGVVPDFPAPHALEVQPTMRVYHAAGFGDVHPVELAMRVRRHDPMLFAGTLREIGAAVDPNLQLRYIETAEMVLAREQGLMRLIGGTVVAVMLSVVVLAAAGMYALMSFTVARRRREIGIRAALGANPRRILGAIFARAAMQLGLGGAVGLMVATGLEQVLEGEMFQGQGAILVPVAIAVMAGVGLLAALGPARKGLRIQPIDALREE
jgi:predicted permease